MTKAKMRLLLEMSAELLQRVHGNICRSNIKKDIKIELSEDIQKIMAKMFLLDNKLKGVKFNEKL